MKMRLVYALTCCVLLAVVAFAGHRIKGLEERLTESEHQTTIFIQDSQYIRSAYDELHDAYTSAVDIGGHWYYQYWKTNKDYLYLQSHPVIKEVTVTREIPVEVEVIKDNPVPVYPREFTSVKEAQDWLDDNNLPIVLIAGENGISLGNIKQDNRYNCNDYSQDLQERALKDGYLITYCPVFNGYIGSTLVTDIRGGHMGAMTRIQDDYYYIEPVPTHPNSFKLVKFAYADRS